LDPFEYIVLARGLLHPTHPHDEVVYDVVCVLKPAFLAGLHAIPVKPAGACVVSRTISAAEADRHITDASTDLIERHICWQPVLRATAADAAARFRGARAERLAQLRRRAAARSIQAAFKRCVCDPRHPACRRRLLREFKEAATRA
jgi:hypothetical protein